MRSIADVSPRNGKRLLLAVAFAAADLCLLGQPLPQQPESTHAKLMILGTFHFDDAGLDDYKPTYRLDLLSPTRQQEVKALLDALTRFRPTKIAVEWPVHRQTGLDAEFEKYLLSAESSVGPNEIY